ncbi:phage tail tube protein [Streptomyces sp. PA03-6a]|nr:phage tail tube protein [Streptomyces sp. PA03-6a]
MAKLVLTGVYLSLNATTLHQYIRKAELSVEVEDADVTNFSSGGWTEVIGGLKSGELAVEFLQDFANGALDATLWPLLGTVVPFELRATQSAVGTSNPKYTGNVLVNGWNPIEGGVGDEASVSLSFPTSGAITRATV